jgi:hypothetical protein
LIVQLIEAVLAANMLGEAQHHRIPHVDIEGLQADWTIRIHKLHNSIWSELQINPIIYKYEHLNNCGTSYRLSFHSKTVI